MAHERENSNALRSESPTVYGRRRSGHFEDDITDLHSATATTDYNAFVGKEEFLSSDDSLPPKQKAKSRAKAKKSRKAQRLVDSSNGSQRLLRPALDILSRLRHDAEFTSQSFTVGYIDRHSPEVMEMPLTSWKGGDVTDEEFIPQHRIVWFKRDADGEKVWDRKERLDKIFGSGSITEGATEAPGTLDLGNVERSSESPDPTIERPPREASLPVDKGSN